MMRIESLLSARLFLQPQLTGDKIYFLSNLSGRLSLYAMQAGGSVPEPLLPPHLALPNPHLLDGHAFYVFPDLGKILVMIDRDGDENYQPMLVPLEGGFPEPAFGDAYSDYRFHLLHCDPDANLVYLYAESNLEALQVALRGSLETGDLLKLYESPYSALVQGVSSDHTRVALIDSYTMGDHVLLLWDEASGEVRKLVGTPIEERLPGEEVPLNAISTAQFTPDDQGLLFVTALFDDALGLGYLDLNGEPEVKPVEVEGAVHAGPGEMVEIRHLREDHYLVIYNINGSSWAYETVFNTDPLSLKVKHIIAGHGELSNGVLEAILYDEAGDRFALTFSTASSPTQIYSVDGAERQKLVLHTNERILGIPQSWLSAGEDATFISFDGTTIPARLYLPAVELGFQGPRPLVYYIHGGPQSQERPNFAWFSMPLIQFLTLKGFAVFVPNVRGSTGYGLSFTKQVDHDWGGQDRLDHVHAMNQVLPQDSRLDLSRSGVVGRSYGGYMTLTLAGRHPELWSAAVDMFGPYDLITFSERIPETWKPYFRMALGDPETDRDFLVERSPRTHLHQLACPMLVIQGKNDPRVVEAESRDLVEALRREGKEIDYLMFENEGHDVLKFENRVAAYNAITDFFVRYLCP